MIGGLKEKLLAAKRLGITKVLVPKSNEKDVKEFEEEVVEGLEIVYVKTMTHGDQRSICTLDRRK